MAVARVRNPVVVSHPDTGQFITISRNAEFSDNDPIVKSFAWAFEDDDVEQATAAPGEKRTRGRANKEQATAAPEPEPPAAEPAGPITTEDDPNNSEPVAE